MTHARKIVTVEVDQTVLRILDSTGTVLTVVPRTNTQEVTRHKAYGTMNRTTGQGTSTINRRRNVQHHLTHDRPTYGTDLRTSVLEPTHGDRLTRLVFGIEREQVCPESRSE
jgi:hypothetical protein